jgi:hypothetical protein
LEQDEVITGDLALVVAMVIAAESANQVDKEVELGLVGKGFLEARPKEATVPIKKIPTTVQARSSVNLSAHSRTINFAKARESLLKPITKAGIFYKNVKDAVFSKQSNTTGKLDPTGRFTFTPPARTPQDIEWAAKSMADFIEAFNKSAPENRKLFSPPLVQIKGENPMVAIEKAIGQ